MSARTFSVRHNGERFSVKSQDRVRYYRGIPSFPIHNKSQTLPFVASTFVPAYYSAVALCDSAADQARICTVALTEFVFMAG